MADIDNLINITVGKEGRVLPDLTYKEPEKVESKKKEISWQESVGKTMTDVMLSFNTSLAEAEKAKADRKNYADKKESTSLEVANYITSMTDETVKNRLLYNSDGFNSIQHVDNRIDWYNRYDKAVKDSHDTLGTVGVLAAGVPAMITDLNQLPLLVATEGASIFLNTAKYAGRAYALNMAAGGTSGYIYANDLEDITDQPQNKTLMTGGGIALGAFTTKVGLMLQSPEAVVVDNATNRVLTKSEAEQALATELEAHTQQLKNIDEAIAIESNIKNSITEHKATLDDLTRQQKGDVVLHEEYVTATVNKIDENINKTKASITETTTKAKEHDVQVKESKAKLDESTNALDNHFKIVEKEQTVATKVLDKITASIEKAQTTIANLTQKVVNKSVNNEVKIRELGREITYLESSIRNKASSKTRDKEIVLQIKAYKKEIESLRKEQNNPKLPEQIKKAQQTIRSLQNGIKQLEAQFAKTQAEIEKKTLVNEKNRIKLEESRTKAEEIHNTNLSKKEEYANILKGLKDTLDIHTKSKPKFIKEARESFKNTGLSYLIDTTKGKLTKALNHQKNLEDLLITKGILSKETADIVKGKKFKLSNLRTQLVNKMSMLQAEITKEASRLSKETLESYAAKNINPIFEKLIISPIEKLKSSKNKAVSGLATLLHSGTLHRGKANLYTANDVRMELDQELVNKIQTADRASYYEALKSGEFKGSMEEFTARIGEEMAYTASLMEKEATKGIPAGLSSSKAKQMFYDNLEKVQLMYRNDTTPIINKSVARNFSYYEKIWDRGHSLGMVGFKNTVKKAYMPIIYSATKIMKLHVNEEEAAKIAIEHLVNAQIKYANRFNQEINDELIQSFRVKATKAVASTMKGENITSKLNEQITSLSGLGDKESIGTSGRVKERKINAFYDDLVGLMDTDSEGLSTVYGLQMHGRIALKERIGIETQHELETLFDTINAGTKDRDNLSVVIDTVLGRREVDKKPMSFPSQAIRGLSSFSSLMHTGAFGVPTITEISSIMKEVGFFPTMKHLFKNIPNVVELYTKGTISDKNIIELTATYGEALLHHRAIRTEAEGLLHYTGKVQELMDKGVNKLSIFGGLSPITDLLKLTSQTVTTEFITKASVGKIAGADMKRLLDMGIGKEELVMIKDRLGVTAEGRITNMDRSTWGEVDDLLLRANRNMVNRMILHPDGATLPHIMTNYDFGGIAPRIFTKFLRFPVEAWERLVLRGLQEADIKQATAVLANTAMWYYILQAKDALKDPADQKYSALKGEEGKMELFKDSMLANSYSAPVMTFADLIAGATTGETTRGYPASMGAPAMDLSRAHNGQFNISLPFYTHKVHLEDSINNMMLNNTYMTEFADTLKGE